MATEIIRPNSYITRSSVNIHDSDDAYTYYQVVNEEVANDSSYIYTRSNAQYVVMGLSNPTTVSGTIVNVALYARCWHENAAIVGYYNVG